MRTLRGRLQLVTTLILALTIAAAGLAFVKVSRNELSRLSSVGGPDLETIARTLETRLAGAPAPLLAPVLAALGKQHATGLILARETRVLAATPEFFATAHGERGPDGSLVFHAKSGGDGVTLAFRGNGTAVRLPDGFASLYPVPASPSGALRPLERAILFVVLAAGLVGTLLVFALTRRLTGPLESLNAAVRRLEEGDPSVRVPVKGDDEIARLGASFNALAARTETSERLRREMVADVAHELRAPLTNLRGELESLQDGVRVLDAGRVDSLHAEILSLCAVVDDLQDLALADAGQMTLETTPVDLRNLARRVLPAFEASAGRAGVSLALADGPPVRAEVDDRRIGQALRNLVENAVAHTRPGGRITVEVTCAGARVRIGVEDTGQGIAPEDLALVFERFYRADPSRARATGGAGLGLAITKKIVEAHGGTIGARSVPGIGSTFWIEIPGAR
jgi:signal transduction histidine kinase